MVEEDLITYFCVPINSNAPQYLSVYVSREFRVCIFKVGIKLSLGGCWILKPRYPAFTLALLMLGFVNIIKSIFKYCSVSVNDHVPFDCFRFVPLKSQFRTSVMFAGKPGGSQAL